ncbi:hypothetical protein EMPG_14087 [Blastomyces silverae]|uniref:Uncharacterized protein n=1 Tax=Blastomyces silverae TaxID=2060906 RepID=A0A0H1BGB0_9EURO|nr:hypothetical protein EMPG_14087 [Blastomyces silverae]
MVTINLLGAGWDGSTNGTRTTMIYLPVSIPSCSYYTGNISWQEGKLVSNRLKTFSWPRNPDPAGLFVCRAIRPGHWVGFEHFCPPC